MELIKKEIEFLKENNVGFFKGEISSELILKAELFLDIKFPNSYKYFIANLGCGSIKCLEFYGIVNENFTNGKVPNGIWLTYNERIVSNLPKYLLIIGQSEDGYYTLIPLR